MLPLGFNSTICPFIFLEIYPLVVPLPEFVTGWIYLIIYSIPLSSTHKFFLASASGINLSFESGFTLIALINVDLPEPLSPLINILFVLHFVKSIFI